MKKKLLFGLLVLSILSSLLGWSLVRGHAASGIKLPKAAEAPGETVRVSVASDGTQANDGAGVSSISGNGRYIAFTSWSNNLVSGDTNDVGDVFVHDRETGETTRVSIATDGTQGTGGSSNPGISNDGRYVAFESAADNLVLGDVNGRVDIFLHDRQTGQTVLISVATDGTQANQDATHPSISGDGRYIAFQSRADNLVPGDVPGLEGIFVHDRETSVTNPVSLSSGPFEASYFPSLSYDGRYIAFQSTIDSLVPDDTNGRGDIFVFDQQTNQTSRVSIASDGTEADANSFSSAISDDGRYVTFTSVASNLGVNDTNGIDDIFVHDRQTGVTERISVASDGTPGDSYSAEPDIAGDGRYVGFLSNSSNLVPGDTNGSPDAFIHDLQTGETIRVSIASDGSQGNSSSDSVSVSVNGRDVAFNSNSDNLVPGDTNDRNDVFVHHRFLLNSSSTYCPLVIRP